MQAHAAGGLQDGSVRRHNTKCAHAQLQLQCFHWAAAVGAAAAPRGSFSTRLRRWTASGSAAAGIQAKQRRKKPGSAAWQSAPGVRMRWPSSQARRHRDSSASQLASGSHCLVGVGRERAGRVGQGTGSHCLFEVGQVHGQLCSAPALAPSQALPPGPTPAFAPTARLSPSAPLHPPTSGPPKRTCLQRQAGRGCPRREECLQAMCAGTRHAEACVSMRRVPTPAANAQAWPQKVPTRVPALLSSALALSGRPSSALPVSPPHPPASAS